MRLDVSTEIPLLRGTISGMLKDAADHRDETRAGCVALRLSHPYQKGGGCQRAYKPYSPWVYPHPRLPRHRPAPHRTLPRNAALADLSERVTHLEYYQRQILDLTHRLEEQIAEAVHLRDRGCWGVFFGSSQSRPPPPRRTGSLRTARSQHV